MTMLTVLTETQPDVFEPDPAPKARVAEYPRARQVLAHLSDTHLLAGDGMLYGQVNSEQRLAEALYVLECSEVRPDALVFTGDLADLGEPDAYLRLRALVEQSAQRMGSEIIWVMGNHDDREQFRQHMLDQLPSTDAVDHVYDLAGLRVITLDSTVPGHHHGHVTDEQLAWLTQVLATPAEHGTVLAMHHPPIPMVKDAAVNVELIDQQPLADVLRGTDVRTILSGHLHYSSHAMFAGIPVSVASATCYTQDLTVGFGELRPRDGAQAFNLVHVYDETIVHTVVPVGRDTLLQFVSAEEVQAMLVENGVQTQP